MQHRRWCKRPRERCPASRGFTFLELVVVIAVMGIVAGSCRVHAAGDHCPAGLERRAMLVEAADSAPRRWR
jgi:prepilin-type N-terminal cleavage/methylation domain-containing protein